MFTAPQPMMKFQDKGVGSLCTEDTTQKSICPSSVCALQKYVMTLPLLGFTPHYRASVRLAKITENAILRLMAACIVSFVDLDGIRHSVEVEAEGLYEASVLGLCAFRRHKLEPGGLTQLEVEVRSSETQPLTVTKVREWLQ